MSEWANAVVRALTQAFEPRRDPARAAAQRKYMRDQFAFLGIGTSERRALQKEALTGIPVPDPEELLAAARALWLLTEREYQYAGTELLIRYESALPAQALPVVAEFITGKPWWDTVDGLAPRVVGPMVRRYPALGATLDEWIRSDDRWLVRAAILHQLTEKANTDQERLFRYCLQRADEREFFIRKAIGWALREYSKTAPSAVREFVAAHEAELSGLSKREALLWITGRPGSKRQAEVLARDAA